MKKVLITGATSSQCSVEAHKRNRRFSWLISQAVQMSGYESEVKSLPIYSSEKDIEEYDTVIVGLAPFTSLSANKIYTAINTLSLAMEQGKGKVLFDAPEPHLVYQSFKSVLNNPSILTKNLYAKRDGYETVFANNSINERIYSVIEKIVKADYDIIIPSLPYFEYNRDIYGIPESSSHGVYGFNFDQMFKDDFNVKIQEKSKYWLAENPSSKWTKALALTVSKPVLSLKRSAYDIEIDYVERIHDAYGYLLETYKNQTPWWSPNIMLSLSCGVPVFSEWRHTGGLGVSWSGLPHTVEDFTYEERYALSVAQKESYLSNIDSLDVVVENFAKTILS